MILPKDHADNLAVTVEELMAPYYEDGEWFRDGSRWDWYVLGGRWDGAIRGLEWDPKLEVCLICDGTGERPGGREQFGDRWYEEMNGCNGCLGEGKSEAWPTDKHYQSPERNITKMSEVAADYTPYAFVKPTGEWVEQSRVGFFGADIPDENGKTKEDKIAGFDQQWAEAREGFADHIVVGLDCHV